MKLESQEATFMETWTNEVDYNSSTHMIPRAPLFFPVLIYFNQKKLLESWL